MFDSIACGPVDQSQTQPSFFITLLKSWHGVFVTQFKDWKLELCGHVSKKENTGGGGQKLSQAWIT